MHSAIPRGASGAARFDLGEDRGLALAGADVGRALADAGDVAGDARDVGEGLGRPHGEPAEIAADQQVGAGEALRQQPLAAESPSASAAFIEAKSPHP